ncbi:MAG: hypothetical protein ABI442_01925 [Gemmatimonadaceae bacterium]
MLFKQFEGITKRSRIASLVAVFGAIFAVACTENLDAGKSCPLLCPEQAITLADTTIDAVVSDTTVLGLPPIGNELYLMLSNHGDTVDSRAIIRFDTLPQTYTKSSIDSTIANIDSAFIVAPIRRDTLAPARTAPVTVEVYNVDTTDSDTSAAVLGSLFRRDRFIGSRTFAPESILDTLRIPISTDTVLDRVLKGTRLRVGLRVLSSVGVDLELGTTAVANAVSLRFNASKDTAAPAVSVSPRSGTPADLPFLSGPLADYTIVLKGGTTTPPTKLAVGGIPSRRVFLHFDVPSGIVDSTTVVRASLLLTQVPNRRVGIHDSVYVYPLAVLAGPIITDVGSALGFLGPTGQFGLDSLRFAPGDSGVRSFEIVGLVRTWKGQATTVSPRSVALRSGAEGQLPGEIDFFSTRGPVGVRPRLRITYVPKTNYGLPR